MPTEIFSTVTVSHGSETVELACRQIEGGSPTLVWLGGYRSDMMGTKAEALKNLAERNKWSNLRFDYSGHGESGGDFEQGTISKWVKESLEIISRLTSGPLILVGSSMGGWISLRLVEEFGADLLGRLAGLVLIAPAPDFATRLMIPSFTKEQQQELAENGQILEPSDYSPEPNIITRAFLEDGEKNIVMGKGLKVGAPIRILQGMKDPDVPYQHVLSLVDDLGEDDVVVTLVRDGDHRLSRDQDIALLERTVTTLVVEIEPG